MEILQSQVMKIKSSIAVFADNLIGFYSLSSQREFYLLLREVPECGAHLGEIKGVILRHESRGHFT